MRDIDIRGLLWDDVNEAHIWERHQIRKDLVEEACQGDHRDIKASRIYNDRYLVITPLRSKKLLTIILAPHGEGLYYPVSARIASKKERREYREWKAGKNP